MNYLSKLFNNSYFSDNPETVYTILFFVIFPVFLLFLFYLFIYLKNFFSGKLNKKGNKAGINLFASSFIFVSFFLSGWFVSILDEEASIRREEKIAQKLKAEYESSLNLERFIKLCENENINPQIYVNDGVYSIFCDGNSMSFNKEMYKYLLENGKIKAINGFGDI